MVVFPNCKINLGLNITGKRNDGYHDLETVFYPLAFCDVLEIENLPADNKTHDGCKFTLTGRQVTGDAENNICVKSFHLLKKDFPDLPPVQIHLHKVIPAGAGLGGGSADGAATLIMLNKKFSLGISESGLFDYALQLGSDCPFFIKNKSCFATGRGEKFEPVNPDLSAYKFVIVYPEIHINTGKAFSETKPAAPAKSLKNIIEQPVSSWKGEMKNDFESTVFKRFPETGKIKDDLYQAGAIYASMSGSGSAVYGIFENKINPVLSFPGHYLVKESIGLV